MAAKAAAVAWPTPPPPPAAAARASFRVAAIAAVGDLVARYPSAATDAAGAILAATPADADARVCHAGALCLGRLVLGD